MDPIAQERFEHCDFFPEGWKPLVLFCFCCTLGDHEGALPVSLAIKQYEKFTLINMAECLTAVVRVAAEAHPHHVHRRTKTLDSQIGTLTHRRVTAVRANGERRANFQL